MLLDQNPFGLAGPQHYDTELSHFCTLPLPALSVEKHNIRHTYLEVAGCVVFSFLFSFCAFFPILNLAWALKL